MTVAWPDEATAVFRRAAKQPLVEALGEEVQLDRDGIEALLPHRSPLLLVHRVVHVDLERGRLVARYPLADAAAVLAGHFPGRPVYPGALQIEAVGQAAILLWCLRERSAATGVALTHVLGARFLRPVPGQGTLEVAVQSVDDGLFTTAVGQVLHEGRICAVAGVRCVLDE
jgi:3-hydroxyacyl-[acyl-carrier-protein] dehydratase